MSKKLIIVVDMQSDFMDFKDSALPVPGSRAIIPATNIYLSKLWPSEVEAVLFTQDWHEADHVEAMPDGTPFPSHCVKDTKGAELSVVASTIPRGIDVFGLRKNVFDMFAEDNLVVYPRDTATAYHSKPIDRDAFFEALKAKGITDIEICGVTTDICANFAVKGALARGFNVTVRRELTKGLFREVNQVNAEDWGGKVTII